jgi:hypothetical protein
MARATSRAAIPPATDGIQLRELDRSTWGT